MPVILSLFRDGLGEARPVPFPTANNAQYNSAPFSRYALKGKSPAATYCIVCMLYNILLPVK